MARVALVPNLARLRIAAEDFAQITERPTMVHRQMREAKRSLTDVRRSVQWSVGEIDGLGPARDAARARRLLNRALGQADAIEQALNGVPPRRPLGQKWFGHRRYATAGLNEHFRALAKTMRQAEKAVQRSPRIRVPTLADAELRKPGESAVETAQVDSTWSKHRGGALQKAIRGVNALGIQKALRVRVHNADNVPRDGGVLLVPATHGSWLDGYFFGVGHSRTVRPVAKAELFK